MANPPTIRPATPTDAAPIAAIYNHFIRETIITFEEEEIDAAGIEQRLAETSDAGLPWLVAERDGAVLGYCYASKWKGRCAYRHSVEITVYLHPEAAGQGLGTLLYEELLNELKRLGMHAVIGGIALPNDASIALHEKIGMKKVAHFEQVGFKFGKWIDVGYWQLFL